MKNKLSRIIFKRLPVTIVMVIVIALMATLYLVTLYASPVTVGNFTVDYVIQSDWGNGATINVTFTNNGPAIQGWTVGWTFPGNQQITNMWNASYTQSGATVSAKNLDFNASIPTNGSQNFGFNISYTGSNTAPTSFTVNSSTSNTPTPTRSMNNTPTPTVRTNTPTPTYRIDPTPTSPRRVTPTFRLSSTPTFRPSSTPARRVTPTIRRVTVTPTSTATPTPTVRSTPTPTPRGNVNIPWNWAGIVGTGQSLSVGAQANPVISTTQPYHNLKLSLGSLVVPPWDSSSSQLSMVPLVEPIRNFAQTYPGPYPGNIYGETPHTAMANQITSLVMTASGADYISVHTVVGESGQGIDCLKKGAVDNGSTGRAYAATLFEVQAIKRLAVAAGKTYGVGAVVITHGETDSGNTNYENELYKLWSDYNADIKAITGQTQDIILFTNQQNSCGPYSFSTLVQWKAGVDYLGKIICVGPKYQYPYASDGVHLVAEGYRQLGEKHGQVYFEKVVMGRDWLPLQPTSVVRTSSRVVTVNLHVPVAPLVWDTTLPAPNQSSYTEWANGKGFELYSSNGTKITISSVAISGSSVSITSASDLPTDLKVGYAYASQGTQRANGTVRWGLLRDSDPFKGNASGVALPNYCVSFELAVP